MTIADEINRLSGAKAAIKQSIVNKGVDVSDEALLNEYPALIDMIGASSDPDINYENPDFYELLTKNGTDYSYLFTYKTIDDPSFIESLDTSKVTDMSYAFQHFKSSSELNLSGWDVSNIKSDKMGGMFSYSNILELDVSGWSFSNTFTSLVNVFTSFRGKNIYGLNTWDVSNVKYFGQLFQECLNLVEIDISGWDTSNGISFQSSIFPMIYGCSNLERVIGVIDMSNNNGPLQYSASYALTKGCKKLKELRLVNIYKNTPVKNEAGYSLYLEDTQIEDQYLIEIINELPDLINDKGLTDTSNLIIKLPPTNTLTQEQVQVAVNKGWQVANTTY